ncbi:MAG: inverse autotransporter beta domain-containing protein, partial [Candidatus Puniceispirillaceae bacterium]
MKKFILSCACGVMLASPVWADGLDMLGRTSVSVSDTQDGDAAFEIETIQPISQTAETLKHTVFFQGRLASQNSDETINVGIGYRNLADDENIIY